MDNHSLPSTAKHCISIAVLTLLTLSGCSSLESVLENKVDYRSGSDNLNRNPLEIPPDLTQSNNPQNHRYHTPGASSYTDRTATQNVLSTQANTVLPTMGGHAKLFQDGNTRWLSVNAPPEAVWPQVREFWLSQGFALETDNPNIGVLETDWLENRAKLPQDMVRKLIGKVIDNFMSTGEMDKYRTRIERGPNNSTEIFISHRGMVEVFKDSGKPERFLSSTKEAAQTIWTPRPTDPELETEMLRLMLQQLGVKAEVAKSTVTQPVVVPTRSTLVDSAQGKALLLNDSFDRAWRRIGLALDRIGYVVIDRNRAEGVYYVYQASEDTAKEAKPGLLASLAFWRSKDTAKKPDSSNTVVPQPELEVRLTQTNNNKTQVHLVPIPTAGEKIDRTAVLSRLLTELQ